MIRDTQYGGGAPVVGLEMKSGFLYCYSSAPSTTCLYFLVHFMAEIMWDLSYQTGGC